MDFRQLYARFREWQQNPYQYEFSSQELQHCKNCGHDFTGNFCPYCGQRSGIGRITWKSVVQGISLLWGMDSRALSYSLLQLFGRPGYFIREYISGHRQVSFPPIKMLVIVALLVTLIEYLFLPEAKDEVNSVFKEESVFYSFSTWMGKHKDWYNLLSSTFSILPIWMMFRHGPAYPKHTIPEGFFIQVFLCVINVIVSLFGFWVQLIITFFYNVVAYKQIFGYGWWGTIWRFLVAVLLMMLLFLAFLFPLTFVAGLMGVLNI